MWTWIGFVPLTSPVTDYRIGAVIGGGISCASAWRVG